MAHSKQISTAKISGSKTYDPEERTFQFAKEVALFVGKLPRSVSNIKYSVQVVRASGSVGANYREANEALSEKDFSLKPKISRREVKESEYWLRLIAETNDESYRKEGKILMNEAIELKKILSVIISKPE